MAKTVVVSPQGFDGIDARPGRDLEVADGAAGYIASLLRLLESDAGTEGDRAMGANARRLVVQRYAWQRNVERLRDLLQGASLDIHAAPSPARSPRPLPEASA